MSPIFNEFVCDVCRKKIKSYPKFYEHYYRNHFLENIKKRKIGNHIVLYLNKNMSGICKDLYMEEFEIYKLEVLESGWYVLDEGFANYITVPVKEYISILKKDLENLEKLIEEFVKMEEIEKVKEMK